MHSGRCPPMKREDQTLNGVFPQVQNFLRSKGKTCHMQQAHPSTCNQGSHDSWYNTLARSWCLWKERECSKFNHLMQYDNSEINVGQEGFIANLLSLTESKVR